MIKTHQVLPRYEKLAGICLCLALLVGGCGATLTADVALRHPYTFVAVGPGLWVAADYDYPVYYYDGFYWGLYAGAWYRRVHMGDAWARVARVRVPHAVVSIRHDRYIRYRPRRQARVWDVRRGHPSVRSGSRVRQPGRVPTRGRSGAGGHDRVRRGGPVRDHGRRYDRPRRNGRGRTRD